MEIEKKYSAIEGIESKFGGVVETDPPIDLWHITFKRRNIGVEGSSMKSIEKAEENAWLEFDKAMTKWEESHSIEEKYLTLYPDIQSCHGGVLECDPPLSVWTVKWKPHEIFILSRSPDGFDVAKKQAWERFETTWTTLQIEKTLSLP